MATNVERRHPVDASVQIEQSGSYILQQCLNVVTTFAEFRNLTYRVSRTCNNMDVMIIYREKLLGVFGPALDPVTLTIDPNGRCLVSVLFKPVQRVSLISGNAGGMDILSLLAMLRMISGKGFLFCPGIPEKFFAGKAFGRFVECHRAPFKRFQSPQCPVYYQMRAEQQDGDSQRPTMFKMCPQCRQVATIVLRLPPAPQVSRGAVAQTIDVNKLSTDTEQTLVAIARPNNLVTTAPAAAQFKHVIPAVSENQSGTLQSGLPSTSLLSLPVMVGDGSMVIKSPGSSGAFDRVNTARSVSVLHPKQQQQQHSEHSVSQGSSFPNLKRSTSEPQGQGLTEDAMSSLLSARSATTTEALRNVLLQKRIKLDISYRSSQGQDSGKAAVKSNKGKKEKRNVCRICKKMFSSPANLLNHLQRHEGFSGSLPEPLKAKLSSGRQNSSSALMRIMLRGAKSHSTKSQKKNAVSDTSMRLFMKCLNNLVSSQNGSANYGARSLYEQSKIGRARPKSKKPKMEEMPKVAIEEQTSEPITRPSLSRSSSGLSAMQTLLEAAAIAGKNSNDLSMSSAEGYDAETASYNSSAKPTLDHSVVVPPEVKQHRKSPRIASRLKKKELANSAASSASSGSSVVWPKATQPQKLTEPGHLTNLDLLSSVSLDMEKRKPVVTSASSHPATPSSTPQNVTASNALLKMPPQDNVVNNKFGGPPPLLFAKPGKDGKLPNWLPQSVIGNIPQPVNAYPTVVEESEGNVKVLSPDCGAMDLSKPKLPNEVALVSLLGQPNKPSGVPPTNFMKLVSPAGPENIPVELLLNAGSGGQQQPIPMQSSLPRLPGVVSMNKISDANLQSRMFASARDYKMDKKPSAPSGTQIHAMVASRGGAVQPGSDEIQCGYKWSGSGGQVKERTQMVRELVPQDVMATYLNKQFVQPQPQHQSQPQHQPQPHLLSHPPRPTTQAQQDPPPRHAIKGPRPAAGTARAFLPQQLKSLPKFPPPPGPNEEMSCQVALNLTTGPTKQKAKESGAKAKPAPRSKRQSRKSGQAAQPPQAQAAANMAEAEASPSTDDPSGIDSAAQQQPLPGASVTLSCTFSSPSLAAILQQPATTIGDSVSVTASIKAPSPSAQGLNNGSRPHSNSSSGHLKFEPPGTPDDNDCVILSLPIKPERRASHKEKHVDRTERESSASPGNLVMDLQQSDPAGAAVTSRGQDVKQEAPPT